MQTIISFPFMPTSLSMDFAQEILTAAAIVDVLISGITQSGNSITFSANRYLTDAEKGAVKNAFMAALIQIEDVQPTTA